VGTGGNCSRAFAFNCEEKHFLDETPGGRGKHRIADEGREGLRRLRFRLAVTGEE